MVKMSISKKTRFDIFKRDGFACAYCGRTPPAVVLEIDHIQPKSKGGREDLNNYITACFDCNRGKRNVPLSNIPPKVSENISILLEREEQLREYNKILLKIERRTQKDVSEISSLYQSQYEGWEFSEKFKNVDLRYFLRLLPKQEIIEALHIAMNKIPGNHTTVIRYFCGVCWRKIKRKQGVIDESTES